jgi:hypothetical protein
MPGGQPKLITKAKEERVARLIFLAYTDSQIATMVGVCKKTIQRARHAEYSPRIARLALEYEEPFRQKMWEKGFEGGIAWMLERRYPSQFAKPEVQLSLQNNYHVNALQINITSVEAKEIAAQALPEQLKVKEMFAQYRPDNGNGNGEQKSHS